MIPVFIAYLKQHRKSILLFALFALIFLAVIYLYRLPAARGGIWGFALRSGGRGDQRAGLYRLLEPA